MVKSRKRGQ